MYTTELKQRNARHFSLFLFKGSLCSLGVFMDAQSAGHARTVPHVHERININCNNLKQ